MHLGLMTHPLTGKTEVSLLHAGYTLDLLDMLQEKTKGNRSEEESEYLAAALHNLRLEYVRVARERKVPPQAKSKGGDAAGGGDANPAAGEAPARERE
jgi:hypothetical protein